MKPKAGENQADYIARFISAENSRADYPEEGKRVAAAVAMWEHRTVLENAMGYKDGEGAVLMRGRHLEPGLVRYDEIKNQATGVKGVTLLLTKSAIDSMRSSFIGKPVVNNEHKAVNPEWFKEGKADGVVVGGLFNSDDAWEHVDFLVWDSSTKKNARGGFQLSCAYTPGEVDWTPGKHHNLPYDGVILNGAYTHLAVVPSPRYEGAVIYANSKGENMILELLGLGKDKPVALDKETPVTVDGKKRTVAELVNALAAADAAAAAAVATVTAKPTDGEGFKDSDFLIIDGKKRTVLEAMNALREADKKSPPPAVVTAPAAEGPKPEEIANAVDAAVKKALDALKGDTFFNAVALAAAKRGGEPIKPATHQSQKEKEALGRARYGKRMPAAAK